MRPKKSNKEITNSDIFKEIKGIKQDNNKIKETLGDTKDDIKKIWDTMSTKDAIKKIWETMATKDDIKKIWNTMATKDDIKDLQTINGVFMRELLVLQSGVKEMKVDMIKKADFQIIMNRLDDISQKFETSGRKSTVHDHRLNEAESKLTNHETRITSLEKAS